jgi:hypothetical protein
MVFYPETLIWEDRIVPESTTDAARFLLAPERMEKLVELYRQAKQTGDEHIVSAANDVMKHFRDAEAALAQMLAAEAAVNQLIGKQG